jgi:8-oxo-dGTP pyrophosphatase MutT (NUDIX family)
MRGTDEPEHSAGCVLMRTHKGRPQALMIRFRAHGYELPKGHLEPGETHEAAAARELTEETGILNEPHWGPRIEFQEYTFRHQGRTIEKDVAYFLATIPDGEKLRMGTIEDWTQELRWIQREDLDEIQCKHEAIRDVVAKAFDLYETMRGDGALAELPD